MLSTGNAHFVEHTNHAATGPGVHAHHTAVSMILESRAPPLPGAASLCPACDKVQQLLQVRHSEYEIMKRRLTY